MECKKCKAQLEPGVTLCPECGTDNTPEAPKGITLTPGKLVAVIAAVVVLTAVVVALILHGMGFNFDKPEETVPATEALAAPEGTIPPDGNPEDATCKGSYTISDAELEAHMSQVVATCGEAQLTNGQLQVYYWMQVQSFLGEYGSYAPYLGLDITKPLDTQVCTISEITMTWQQYFLEAALADWHNYLSLSQEGKANGFVVEQQYLDQVDGMPESLATDAGVQGFESAEDYLTHNLGNGATIADYQQYWRNYYEGLTFFQSEYDSMVPTQEELEAYFAEHEAEYAQMGVGRNDYNVDVRHILVLPEGATVDTIYTETFSEEAWAVGEANANDILNQWLSDEATEESFAALANEKSADTGSNTNGGLYTDVVPGQMTEEFDAWCFEEGREPGDYAVVKTALGYHVMYFSAKVPNYNVDIRHILVLPEGATVDTIYTETFPEEAWAVGEANANDILNQWLSGEATEESFAALANEKSADPGSNVNGGLYTDVAVGDMVEEFDAWCFDASRQAGNYGIVKTSLGYHIMYFSGKAPLWEAQAERDLMSERGMDLIYATTGKYPLTVEYAKIAICDAEPSQW